MSTNNKSDMIMVEVDGINQPLYFAKGTSPEDIALAVEYEAGNQKPFAMDFKKGPFDIPYDPKGKTVDLEPNIPEPPEDVEEGEGYLMERGAIDLTSMGAGFAGAKVGFDVAPAQYKPVAALVGGALGSASGAFAGSYVQYGIQDAYNSPLTPNNAKEAFTRASIEGGKAGLIDLTLGSIFQGVGYGWRFVSSPRGEKALAKLQSALTEAGSSLTFGQALDDTIIGATVKGMEELLRGGVLTKGAYSKIDKAQQGVFFDIINQTAAEVADKAVTKLSPGAFGRFIKILHKRGDRIHDEISQQMFKFLGDDVSTVAKKVAIEGGADVSSIGQKAYGVKKVSESFKYIQVQPVDLNHLRKSVNKTIEDLKQIGLAEEVSEGVGLLTRISKGDGHLSFEQAHKLMSGLKRMQRSGKLVGNPANVEVKGIIDLTDEAFNKAGNLLGGDMTKQYKAAREFFKKGAKAFQNKTLTKMLEMQPSKLGTYIAKDASIEDVAAIMKMVKYLSKLKSTKMKADGKPEFPQINYTKTMRSIQAGAIAELLPARAEDILKSGLFQIGKEGGKKRTQTLNMLLGEKGVKELQRAAGVIERILTSHSQKGALTSRQLGIAGQMATASALPATAVYAAAGLTPAIATFLVAPAIASRLFTWPAFVNTLVAFEKNPIGSAARRRLAAKMTIMATRISKDPDVKRHIEASSLRVEEKYNKSNEALPWLPSMM